MKNEIVLNEEEIDGLTSSLSDSYKSISTTGEAINPNFSGVVNAGLVGNSIGIISNQMSSISNTISNTQGLIDEYKNQLLSYDGKMATKIDDIEMPKDFIINNSSKVNMFTQSLLSKMDGKSVNDGSAFSSTYDTFDSSISNKALSDFSGSAIGDLVYDESSIIDKEDDLNSISKSSSTDEVSYDDLSSIEENFMLIDMIPRDSMDEFTYEDTSIVNEQNLYDISNNNYVEDFSNYKVVGDDIDQYMDRVADDEINFYMNKYEEEE